MSYQLPTKCPVCQTSLRITRLSCPSCKTELSGSFVPCKYCALDEKQQMFLETFLRCRGNIKDVERTLSLSYPTVKGLLDELLRALYPADAAQKEETLRVSDVLDRLENKEITAQEAAKLLAQLKGE